MKTRPYTILAASAFLLITSAPPTSAATNLTFEFNQDGVLPSASGAMFRSVGVDAETSAFSVSGGLLHQDTRSLAGFQSAFYVVPDVFDHSIPTVLEWRARVTDSPGSGFEIALQADGFAWNFVLENQGIFTFDSSGRPYLFVIMDPRDTFHTYRIEIPANADTWDFIVDGSIRNSGFASTNAPPENRLIWGGNTPGAGDWDYIRLTPAGSPTAPYLNLSLLPDLRVQLTWLTNFTGYALEYTTRLPPTSWADVSNGVTTTGEHFSVMFDTDASQRFFRLHKP